MKKLLSLDFRLWVSSILNVIALLSGLIAILQTHNVKGQSPTMYVMFLLMQVTFAEAGFRKKLWGQFFGMTVSAVITIIVLCLIFVWG